MRSPGYWIKESVFSDVECDHIARRLCGTDLGRSRAGARNVMSVPEISVFANDKRLLRIGKEITGLTLTPYKATLFEKTGKANWLVAFHQDTALPIEHGVLPVGWGPSSVKSGVVFAHAPTEALQKVLALRIHLDASTFSNGPLRVIPNSHNKRIYADEEFSRCVARQTEVKCLVGKGGVIAMSPLLIHASSKSINDERRRVLHIEYTESLDIGEGIRLAIA